MRWIHGFSLTILIILGSAACETSFMTEDGDGEEDADTDAQDGDDVQADDLIIRDEVDAEDVEIPPNCGNGTVDSDEECDDGNDVNGDGCEITCTYSCHGDGECDDGLPCTQDVCDPDLHTCSNPLSDNTVVCRPAANDCDLAEMCDGVGTGCPEDAVMDDGDVCPGDRNICLDGACVESVCGDGFVDTAHGEFCEPSLDSSCTDECTYSCTSDGDCTADANPCNGEEYCNLSTHVCDHRNPLADGTVCASDPRQICISQNCQASSCGDGYIDAGATPPEECEDGNSTSGDGCEPSTCRFSCHNATECDDGHACTSDACDTSGSHTCSNTVSASGTVCRAVAGPCDAEERCDGTSQDCPGDGFLSGSTTCRAATGPCDISETCSGTSASCPTDNFQPAGTPCDDGVACTFDVCDGSGHCTGLNELHNVSTVVTGANHACALTTAGGVKCWGRNENGQLGDGTTVDKAYPVDVSGLTSGVSAITAGGWHTCALISSTNAVRCWGLGNYGQLGNGSTSSSSTPVTVSGLSALAIAAGDSHTCARLAVGGAPVCWGRNSSGQLGDGSNTNSSVPVNVGGGIGNVSSISAGGDHSCAVVFSTSGIKCWGENGSGELGNGTTTDSNLPVDVTGLTSGVRSIDAGSYHTCALLTSEAVRCWGMNGNGQLGNASTTSSSTPVNVSGLGSGSGATAINAGMQHTCAVVSTGARCWGRNDAGQVGDGTTTPQFGTEQKTTPVQVFGLSTGVSTVAAGGWHTCARLTDGSLRCWGQANTGQLGDGTFGRRITPEDVQGVTTGMASVSSGSYHACALTSGGGVKCWGDNAYGQLGNGSTVNSRQPVDVTGLASGVTAVAAGGGHTCALMTGGTVKCWGNNGNGQLGDGSTTNRLTPIDVSGLTGIGALTLGSAHSCALTGSGGIKCWGSNSFGQLGDGTGTEQRTPADVSGLTSGVAQVSAGSNHTCAVTTGGGAKCWGINGNGQLGDGTTTSRNTPTDVSGLATGVTAVSGGSSHTCALMTGGGLKCWGRNWEGQVGDGTTTDRTTPRDVVGLPSAIGALSIGGTHSCALTTASGALCWGANSYGQVGNGTVSNGVLTPAAVTGLASGVSVLSAGGSHSCARLSAGGIKCWGSDARGQVTGMFPGYPQPVSSCP